MTASGVGSETLLVICRENVARSPLAAGLVRLMLDRVGRADLTVISAGMEAVPWTPAADEVVRVAQVLGVDLLDHTASSVTTPMVSKASLVVTMTEAQRAAVERMDPSLVASTFTLVELARLVHAIPDPALSWSELARSAHRARPFVSASTSPEDVPDPVGRPSQHYRVLADRLATMCQTVVGGLAPDSVVRSG